MLYCITVAHQITVKCCVNRNIKKLQWKWKKLYTSHFCHLKNTYNCKTLLPPVSAGSEITTSKWTRAGETSSPLIFIINKRSFMDSYKFHICGLRYINHSSSSGFFWSSAIQNGIKNHLNVGYIQSGRVSQRFSQANVVPPNSFHRSKVCQVHMTGVKA